ncbi:MAG: CBS domain-containing protein [Anaerolineae bacterium]|nr:CBS domain-containing protein [Anaerolineae bacterium]
MADVAALQAEIEQLRTHNEALTARIDALIEEIEDARVWQALRASEAHLLCARDIMTPDPVTARPTDTLRQVIAACQAGGFRRLPVLDDDGRLVGIITDRDIRQATNSPFILRERWQDEQLLEQIEVAMCMTPDPVTARPGTPLSELARVMRTRKVGGLPVVDDDTGDLLGIVTETDLLRCFESLLIEVEAQMP